MTHRVTTKTRVKRLKKISTPTNRSRVRGYFSSMTHRFIVILEKMQRERIHRTLHSHLLLLSIHVHCFPLRESFALLADSLVFILLMINGMLMHIHPSAQLDIPQDEKNLPFSPSPKSTLSTSKEIVGAFWADSRRKMYRRLGPQLGRSELDGLCREFPHSHRIQLPVS